MNIALVYAKIYIGHSLHADVPCKITVPSQKDNLTLTNKVLFNGSVQN